MTLQSPCTRIILLRQYPRSSLDWWKWNEEHVTKCSSYRPSRWRIGRSNPGTGYSWSTSDRPHTSRTWQHTTFEHIIQILLRWKQCNGINILLSPPELAAAHLGRPLQTHGVAAGVPRGAVPAVRLRHRGLAGRVLGAGGGKRVGCNTLTSLQF